jgi:hypothetical protein
MKVPAGRWLRQRWRLLLVVVLPPALAAVSVALAVLFGDDDGALPAVEIRDQGTLQGLGSRAEAIRAVEAMSGLKVILPTVLPNKEYRLAYVDSLAPGESGSPGIGFGFRDRRSAEAPWFWVVQKPANTIKLPLPLPEYPTGIAGAQLWLASYRPENIGGNPQSLQFVSRTTQYDRIISFEGTAGADEETGRKVIVSMLRQER